jgi:GntR family transcriptional regulator
MWLTIDPRSSKPMYLQVVDGVKAAIAKGLLAPGTRMPSVRELATQLTLNPNTVAKAYQELERQHVIEVVRGRGTFVAPVGLRRDRNERVQAMADRMRELFIEAHHLQMTDEEVLDLFQNTLAMWREERSRTIR